MATRHNLCPNPCLTNDVSGWGGGATPTRVTVAGFGRTTAAHYVSGTFQIPAPTATGSVVPAQTYTVSVYLRSNVFNQNTRTLYLEWLNASGSPAGVSATATFSLSTGVVARASATGTAPSGAAACRIVVDGINAAQSDLDVTMALIGPEPELLDYFDGDSPPASWDGTPGNSTSTLEDAVAVTGSLASSLPPLSSAASGTLTASGSLSPGLPPLESAVGADAEVTGSTEAGLPTLGSATSGTVVVAGGPASSLPGLAGAAEADVVLEGSTATGLPSLSAAMAGRAIVEGEPQLGLPSLSAGVTGEVLAPAGALTASLPSLAAAVVGESDAVEPVLPPIRVRPPRLAWPSGRARLDWPSGKARLRSEG